MNRDRVGTVLVGLLGLATARACGGLDVEPLPARPAEALAVGVQVAILWALAVAVREPGGAPAAARLVRTLLAAAPFLAFGVLEASGGSVGTAWPGLGAALAVAVALALLPAAPRVRGIVAGALLAVWVGDAVLTSAGTALLPAALNPARAPVAWAAAPRPPESTTPVRGERPGSYVRVPDDRALLARGPGPWWRCVDEGPLPRAGPVVRAFDGPDGEHVERLPQGEPEGPGAETLVVVHGGPRVEAALDLSPYDALVLTADAFDHLLPASDDEAALRAGAIGAWVRAGGLLIGPPAQSDWPGRLGRALGGAGRAETSGLSSAQPLGLGWVLRAENRSQALGLLASPSLRRPVGTAFDGLATPPEPPAPFEHWRADGTRHRGQGALLLAFALAFAFLEPAARRVSAALAALALPTAATIAGLAWASPAVPDLAAHVAVLDLGGPGGRRVEALWLSAGERGYVGEVAFLGGGGVRWIGPPLLDDGRVCLAPGSTAWAVRQGSGRGEDPRDVEDRRAAFLRPWLRGTPSSGRLRFALGAPPAVRIQGLPTPPAWTLTLR